MKKSVFFISTLLLAVSDGYAGVKSDVLKDVEEKVVLVPSHESEPVKSEVERELDALAKANNWKEFAEVMDDYLQKFGYPKDLRFYGWMMNLKISNIEKSVNKKAVKWLTVRQELIRKQLAGSDADQLDQAQRKKLKEFDDAYGRIVNELKK